jgi:hypothetical protein
VHRFKGGDEMSDFLSSVRRYWVQNCLRFGLLYLSEAGCLQLLRHYARASPFFQSAVRNVEQSDVWERRRYLEARRVRSFAWFAQRFALKTQSGAPIP